MDVNNEQRASQDENCSQVSVRFNSDDSQQQIQNQPSDKSKSDASGANIVSSRASSGKKERNDSFNFDSQIKPFSLNFVSRYTEREFRTTADIASCISLIGLPITLLCSFLAYLNLYNK